ncbi:hypothetical protein [Desulfosporosinus sp. SB140]|uniref:hypothetical protein n=1 Tax=Desulfosporosinus paludis TaxID=3115649 RepID=UPI00388DD617
MNTSYLTTSEYKRAPTGIDPTSLDYLSGLSDATAQDAELANVIARASAWIDNYCEMPDGLYASVNTEIVPVFITKDGFLRIKPKNVPIIQLQSFQWKVYPSAEWVVVDLTNVQVYERHFEVMMWFPFFNGPALTIGNAYAYPVSAPYMPYLTPTETGKVMDMQITTQYSYINGYPNTTITNNVNIGDNFITVDDATGVIIGTTMTVYDGHNTEKIMIQGINGNILALTKPLIFAHAAGIAISSIPADVKQACILMTNYLLKEKGVNAIVLQGVSNPQMQKYDDTVDIDLAKEMLRRYKRVV